MVNPAVVTVIQRYIREVQKRGVRISKAVLFGSHAKGLENPDSDIDLLLVGPDFDPRPDRALVAELWRARAKTDSRIEPVAVGSKCWEEDDADPLIEVARREGVPIAPPSGDAVEKTPFHVHG